MITWIAWVVGGAFFILPAFWFYFSFYIHRFGWILGLIISIPLIHTLFPLHFIIAPIFGQDSFWHALWNTWGKILVGSIVIWAISLFEKSEKKK